MPKIKVSCIICIKIPFFFFWVFIAHHWIIHRGCLDAVGTCRISLIILTTTISVYIVVKTKTKGVSILYQLNNNMSLSFFGAHNFILSRVNCELCRCVFLTQKSFVIYIFFKLKLPTINDVDINSIYSKPMTNITQVVVVCTCRILLLAVDTVSCFVLFYYFVFDVGYYACM